MQICVFCSANNHIDPEYFTMAEELGRWIGQNGHTLVYGGHDEGLMECIARATHEAGGWVIGVIPLRLVNSGHLSQYVNVKIYCETLSERKDIMLRRCDAVVALPGGIGTLDEVFTVAASATLAYHHLQVVMYDMKGFWTPLEQLMNSLQEKHMIRGNYHRQITFAKNLEEVVAALPPSTH
ncbi:MAG: TIGR00730 family Rossman fold protein [Prevotella sp.]|nr:TIGR00730 family Rossman fold protein [Prevotella sp.]